MTIRFLVQKDGYAAGYPVSTLAPSAEAAYVAGGFAEYTTQPQSTFNPAGTAVAVAASRDFAPTDIGANLKCTSAGALSLNLTAGLPIGFNCAVTQYGAGKVTITAGAGVTIRSSGGFVGTSGQYATIGIMPLGTNEYVLSGSLS